MFHKRHLNLCLFLLSGAGCFAQQPANPAKTPAFTHSFAINGGLHSRGWKSGLQYSWKGTGSKKTILLLDVLNIKSQKEYKSQNDAAKNAKRYSFGKLNTVLLMRAGYGRKLPLVEKHYRPEIGINWTYSGGVSTALLKPVFLDINYPDPDKPKNNTKPEKYNPDVHTDQSRIYGTSRFRYGLNELKFVPGIFLRSSLSFEWGSYQDELKELEVGFVVDAFGNTLPVMAFEKNQQLFVTAFFCLHFGNKW